MAITSIAVSTLEVPWLEQPAEQAAQIAAGPAGAILLAVAFYPVGCADSGCGPGEKVNILGLTMGGLVGTLDTVELAILGLAIAVGLYLLVGEWSKRKS